MPITAAASKTGMILLHAPCIYVYTSYVRLWLQKSLIGIHVNHHQSSDDDAAISDGSGLSDSPAPHSKEISGAQAGEESDTAEA